MSDITLTSNLGAFLDGMDEAKLRALEIIGGKAESYAKGLVPVDTGRLRNSITHTTEGATEIIGSNVSYSAYVELGTGPHYQPPPEWIQNNAERGHGIGHGSVTARPYLRPAITEHVDEYKEIVKREMKKG